MTSLKTVLYAALAATCLFPLGLAAQDLEEEGEALAPVYASEIEIGVGVNTEEDYKFGKFNGLEDDGAFVIGNIDVRKSRSAGDTSTDYWELSGTNLGLDSRNIYGEYTQENLFSIYLDYDQRVNNLYDNSVTPYSGAGTDRLTLPSNWVPASGVGGMTQLIPSLQDVTFEKDRKKIGGGIKWNLTDLWQLSGNYHHEDKDGTDAIGAIFGSSGGNPRGAIVPIPHDFDFDEFDVGIAYKGARGHFTLTYNMSTFDNNLRSLVFDNAFNNSQWPAASRSTVGNLVQGQLGNVFPDNEAWSINFAGGWNWSPRTRLTVNASYGEMTQDEAFLPFTIISALGGGLSTLPRTDLDGQIDNTYLNANLTHRFNNGFDVKARFTYDDRDNGTPRDVYMRIAGDSQLQSSGTHRVPRPYSFEKWKFEFDAGYRLPRMSKLSAGYAYEEIDRDLQEVATTEEHSFHVKLNTMPVPWMSAWAKYRYATRDGGGNTVPQYFQDVLAAAQTAGIALDPRAIDVRNYFGNLPFLEGEASDEINHLVADFIANPTVGNLGAFYENDPILRKYYMANRDQNQFTANVSFYPVDELTLTLYGRYNNDDYEDSPTGLQESTRGSLTFDAVYAPTDRFSAHAFFTLEKNDYHQRGFESTGSQNKAVALSDRLANYGNNFWNIFAEDSVYTTGAGFEWEVIEDKFDVEVDMTYSDATTDIEPTAEDFAASTRLPDIIPFPDVETRIFRIMLKGDYKYQDGWGVRGYYWYERYNSTDFALDSIYTNSLARGGTGGNVILLGNLSPTYNAHVIGFTIYHQF